MSFPRGAPAAIALALVTWSATIPAAGNAAAGTPPEGHEACVTKPRAIEIMRREIPSAIVTDLAGPLEEIFLLNLLRFEARGHLGADVVISRFRGIGYAHVAVFRDGCMIDRMFFPNLYIQILLRLPKEEGA